MYEKGGVGPDSWGPHGWKFIHYTAMGFPNNPTQQDKNNYKKFYKSLGDVIPCILCKNNYIDHLKEFPLDEKVLNSKEDLMAWTIKIHNIVNKSNGKKEYSISEGINSIMQNDDTCVQKENFTEINEPIKMKPDKISKIVNILPILIFGTILIIQLIRVYCKNNNITL